MLLHVACWGTEPPEFNRDVRPLLAEKCFRCHGPDEAAREADLRLDISAGDMSVFRTGGGEPLLKPGDPAGSELWQRLVTHDLDVRMPPPEADLEPLEADELERIRQWILDGARFEDFWAFAPVVERPLPTPSDRQWSANRIDAFVRSHLEKQQLKPQPEADRRTLIRRVTLDLTGLPPTVPQIRRFLNDASPDAYARLVDRLLASPRYGEHMARYWLDLVRFADTNGIHHDHYREMTPYRDWVIRAFNDNLSFDKFTIYQIAGDLYDSPTIDQQIASGFNRLHLVIDRGTAIPEESFHRNVVDRVNAVGTAFMGLTVGCAVCHDHKYDPISQKEFYQLYAFFNNIDAGPETPGRNLHAPYLRLPTPNQQAELARLERRSEKIRVEINELKASLQPVAAGSDVSPATKTELTERLRVAEEQLAQLGKSKSELEEQISVTLVMKERKDVRPTYVLRRGVYDQPGEEVVRGTPAFLPPLETRGEVPTRMDLARWLTDRRHPLTARVTVNRLWQQFFGVGIVKTAEDFGTQGEWPRQLALLDDLANEFVASAWDVKDLVRTIVLSETYRQASQAPPEAYQADPGNRQLARGSRFRLDAEVIRDQLLAVSGLLDRTMYGKSVKPPQPPNLWKTVSMVSSSTYAFTPDAGADIHRRSVYSFWKRAQPPPQMVIFDAPTRESCIARRERTNTPLQALVLMNEEQYFKVACHLAHRNLLSDFRGDQSRIEFLFESVTSKLPDASELQEMLRALAEFRHYYRQHPELAAKIALATAGVPSELHVDLAAYTLLVNSLLNMDIAKTRD